MTDLIIVCDGDFGLDVKTIVDAINSYHIRRGKGQQYNLQGFLVCDSDSFLPCRHKDVPIIGSISEHIPDCKTKYSVAIVNPSKRKKIVSILKSKGATFTTLRAPWVLAPLDMHFGEGSIIAAQSIDINAEIGSFAILYHCMVGSANIGAYCSIMAFSNVTNAKIGEESFIENNVAILLDVELGSNTCVNHGSVVTKNYGDNVCLTGIPARRKKNK